MLKKIIATGIIFYILGCSTPGEVTLESRNISLTQLQKMVIGALPLGQKDESLNGRDYKSKYFLPQKGTFVEAPNTSKRYQAMISILGDRRPYKISVRVDVEGRRPDGTYALLKHDEGLAHVIIRRIQSTLNKRRDNRNVIDDFHAF